MNNLNEVMTYKQYVLNSDAGSEWLLVHFPKWLETQGVSQKSKFRLRHWVLLNRIASSEFDNDRKYFHKQDMQDMLAEIRMYVDTHYYHRQLAGKEPT